MCGSAPLEQMPNEYAQTFPVMLLPVNQHWEHWHSGHSVGMGTVPDKINRSLGTVGSADSSGYLAGQISEPAATGASSPERLLVTAAPWLSPELAYAMKYKIGTAIRLMSKEAISPAISEIARP
jgi:hypothetical protein